MPPLSKDSHQPSMSSIPPQATHFYFPPDQNAWQPLFSNMLSVISILLVTRVLASLLMKVEILLDQLTLLFPTVIYTWLLKLQEDTNQP